MKNKIRTSVSILISLCICLISLCYPAFGAQKYKFSEDRVIEGSISATELNRVKVEGDRIKEAIGLTEDYIAQGESKTGQIFIKGVDGNNKKPAIFSIITEKNRTIDLKLVPGSKLSETIIIETVGTDIDAEDNSSIKSVNSYEHIKHREQEYLVELIKTGATEVKLGKFLAEKRVNNLTGKLVKIKREGDKNLEIWQVTNTSNNTVQLDEKGFNFGNSKIRAIALEAHRLAPAAITYLYVVKND